MFAFRTFLSLEYGACFSLALSSETSPTLRLTSGPSWHAVLCDALKITLKHQSNAGLRCWDDDAGNLCPPWVGVHSAPAVGKRWVPRIKWGSLVQLLGVSKWVFDGANGQTWFELGVG